MKKVSTVPAKLVVYLAGIAAIAVLTILLPELAREETVNKPVNPYVTYAFLASAYILSLPFFVALYQTLKFLHYIDTKKAFSHQAVEVLRKIKFCAIAFSVMVVIALISGISFARSIDPSEDVTGFITLGFILAFVPVVLAVFFAVLQKLLTDAVAMKSENDLIV